MREKSDKNIDYKYRWEWFESHYALKDFLNANKVKVENIVNISTFKSGIHLIYIDEPYWWE